MSNLQNEILSYIQFDRRLRCALFLYLGSGSTIFLLARAAGVDLLFSIAIK